MDLDIAIVDGIFVYELFDKRDKFLFFIVRMSSTSSNVTSCIFYGAICLFSPICTVPFIHVFFEEVNSFAPRVLSYLSPPRKNRVRVRVRVRAIRAVRVNSPNSPNPNNPNSPNSPNSPK